MYFKSKRFFLFVVSCLTSFAINAQTLYWIGGSGSFNDTLHWSTSPGGKSSNHIPGPNSKIIFSETGTADDITVIFRDRVELNSLSIQSRGKIHFLNSLSPARIVIKKRFDNWVDNKNFQSDVNLEFANSGSESGFIQTGDAKLNADVVISSGNWAIDELHLKPNRTLYIDNAKVNFFYSSLKVGHLLINNAGFLNFDHPIIQVDNEIKIKNSNQYKFKKAHINGQFFDDAKPDPLGIDGIAVKKIGSNVINSCVITHTVQKRATCSPGCDGQVAITLPDPSCYSPVPVMPYNILVTNNTCTNNIPPSQTAAGGPGTYTFTNFCECNSDYVFYITDANGNDVDSHGNVYVPIPSINPNQAPGATTTLNCQGVCNGSINITYNSSGVLPFSFTITPPTGPQVITTSNTRTLQVTNICAGTLTVQVIDSINCTNTFVRNFVSPTAINTNSVLTQISCNGNCNGALTFSATGGSAPYVIAFNPGSTFTVGSGATVGTSSLCPGVVSATLTDAKNCTVTASANLVAPTALSLTVNQTSLACSATCNGSATLNISGGNPAYNYTVIPPSGPTQTAVTSTSVLLNSLCGGTYTVNIRDNNLCTLTRTFNIAQPPAVTVTPTFTNIVCNANCNGAINIATSGGNGGPYSYTWVPVGSFPGATNVSSVTGLCANAYTVNVRDVTACTASVIITLVQPAPLTLVTATQALSCFGSCNASATVTASGGNGSYTYSWSPAPPAGQNTPIISSICGGNSYTVTVRDASLCTQTASITILQAPSFTPNITTTSITCHGLCNGAINASPTGTNTFNYTLTVAGFTSTSAPPYSSLCAGTYTLYMQNTATGCIQSFTVGVLQPNTLSGSINTTNLNCFNVCNGSLAGTAIGGVAPYTISWVTPSGNFTATALTNQCAGNYVMHITDGNGCTNNTITATLTQPPALTLSLSPSPASCAGNCDGAISALVGGGSPGYSFNWSNGAVLNPNTSLCSDNYTLTITDANNCTAVATASVSEPAVITVTSVIQNVNCSGGFTGSATITASGGTGGFTYEFNTVPPTTPLAVNNTGVITGLQQGSYLVSATDANSCTQGITFNITSPTLLTASITGVVNSCNACTGAAQVTASGGTPPYLSYVWTNSVGATVGTATNVSSLCPGNYTVTITDNNLCVTTRTVQIQLVVNISVLAGGSGIACYGQSTGTAVANPSGGTAPYSYTWTNASNAVVSSASVASGLPAGSYTVTVSDQPGCSGTAVINITQPASLTATAAQTNVLCFGGLTGVISVTASGGSSPLTYSWTPSAPNSSVLTGLGAGQHTLTIRDNSLCTLSLPVFTITQNPVLSGVITSTNPTACALTNGALCVSASGGVPGPGYQYTWSPTGGNASCANNLLAGSYNVIIRDNVQCTVSVSGSLVNPAGPVLTVTSSSISCFGAATGGATVTASGVNPFTFTWTPTVTSVDNSTSSIASGLNSGVYQISATDNASCVTTQTINIATAPSLTTNAVVSDITCNGANNGTIAVAPTGGTPAYSFAWSGGLPNSGTVTGLSAGIYSLTVTDATLCATNFTFQVVEPTALTVSTTFSDVRCNGACTGSMVATGSGGVGPISYNWLPVGAFGGAITPTVLNVCPNTYTVIASNANCSVVATVVISEPSPLTSTLILKNATCSNSCNAIATHSVGGGVPGYSYSWSFGPSTNSVLGGLCAGNYVAAAADANGCIVIKSFTVTPPSTFTVSLLASDPRCNAACDGSIATTVSGAQGNVNYNWSLTGSGQNPTGLCFGGYTLVATDDSLCVASAVVNLVNPPLLLANVTTTNASCANSCNGAINSTPVNGILPITYSWTPAAPNTPNLSGLCSGDYTLRVVDANGCNTTQNITLTDPPLLVVNPAVIPSTCGNANGELSANVIGGTPAYTYSWLPPAASSNSMVTGLPAGIYTVIVADANNCTNTVSIALSNSDGPDFIPVSSTSIACNGQCTGAASVDIAGITGGTPGYSVSWLAPAPASTNAISGLCAGDYTVQVMDANNCILFSGVNILQPPAVNLSPSFGLPSCNGTCDGSISLNPTGGVGPSFTYTWLPSGPPNSPVITNACAGNYNILIGDNGNNCIYSQTVILPSQLNITVATNITPNQCFNDCNASVNAFNAQGGVAPYTFNWSNGQVGATATNLCNGTYTLIVTDANGCFNAFPVTITAASQISSTLAITSPSCGFCNGASAISVDGGIAPYTYTWTNGSTSSNITNVCAGIYQVIVKDALNCQQTQTVLVNNSNGITGETFSIQPLPCSGACNGAATVSAQGGNAPISYNWINPVVSNSVVTGLCAGTYYVQMTDIQGCIRTASVAIDPITTLTISTFITPPGCGLSDGVIAVDINGGTLPYTVSWNPPSGSSATLTGIGMGSYTITVTENSPNACAQSQQINVNNATGPVLAATQANINCFNACTGSISVTASGSAGPFAYKWSNGSTATSVINQCKGVLTLTVTDLTTNCATIESYTITDNPQIQAGAPTITQPNCGFCNGLANLNIFGGSPAYTYSWSNGTSGSSVSNLCAGLYQVLVQDVLGCSVNQTIVINNSNGIAGETFSVQGLPCANTCDGSATVTAQGGNGTITYNWITPAVAGQSISNLCAGTYFVQMQDEQGCIRTASVNVDAVTTLSINTTVSQPGCGLNNGSVTVVISGGTPSYAVSWSPVANTTATLNNIFQGTYSVTVTESGPNNCSLTQAINVSNLNGPIISATQTDINCFGQCTGVVAAIATGTSAPFAYNWSVGGNAPTITNLCKGVITLSVTDASNCVSIESFTIQENAPLQWGLPQITEPTCNECNGLATVNVFGGSIPYNLIWTNGATSPSATDLCAGVYQVQITDARGCQKTEDVIINNSTGITGEIFNIQNELCSNTCNGSLTVTAVGGAAPINYNWINPAVNNQVISNLCVGNYFVQMTDANGCIRTSSAMVNSSPGFTFTPKVTLPACAQSNGSIDVTVSGGLAPYTYAWSPVAGNTPSLSGIGAGTYSLVITDGTSCTQSQIFTINSATAPAITYTQSNINCFNSCTGAIDVIASGSVAPFTYSWSVNNVTTPNINNLCKGPLTLTVTSSNGCVNIHSFTVTERPELELSLPNIKTPDCFGACNGAITLVPKGGTLPYTYSWQPTGTTNPMTALCAGIYSVSVIDVLGCENTSTVGLNNPAPITVTTITKDASCSSVADGSIGITVSGGTPAYSFTWTGSAFTATTQNIDNVFAGTYTLALMDNAGCGNDTILTLVPTITITANAGRDTVVCAGNDVVLNGNASTGVLSYSWYQLPNTSNTVSAVSEFTMPVSAGSSTFELVTLSSVAGCFDRDTVVINAFPEIIVDAGANVLIPVFSSVTIGGNPTSFSAISYTWLPAEFLSDAGSPNPVASNTMDITYTVTATDINGCVASDSMLVQLYPEVKIPNGFSPNGDGKNDEWVIDYIDQFPNNTVEVYNRWGEQLFHSQGYKTPFNGKFRGKDLPVGTYYYIIHLNHPAYTKPYTGPLTIFR